MAEEVQEVVIYHATGTLAQAAQMIEKRPGYVHKAESERPQPKDE